MNRSFFALSLALLIHLLFLLLFLLLGLITRDAKEPQKPKENRIKVSLKEMPKKVETKEQQEEIIQKPLDIAPPMPKGSQLKRIVEPISKPPIKYEPKKIEQEQHVKKPQLNLEKPEKTLDKSPTITPIPKIEPIPLTKPYVELSKKEDKKKYDSLDWLSEDKSDQEVKTEKKESKSKSNINNSNLKELYGDEFGKLTPGQQKYLIDNQEIMRRITQEVLNRVAQVNLTADMNVNKTNIVEFYLHPNGDMTDFKFLKNSGYYILDQTTKETIEFAYSRYPRPSEKILVRYNVFYNLARY